MDTVTLNHEQFLSFTGWSDSHCMNKTVRDRTIKLQSMGTEVITVTGKGKGTEYTLQIPAGFWIMLLINGMRYTPIGAEYVDSIINGRDVMNTANGTVVKFTIEIYQELAEKYGAEYKAVEATCTRIRNFLREHGYITESHTKTHRVKRSKLVGGTFADEWVLGEEAVIFDQRARAVWSAFFQKKLRAYQRIEPNAESIPIFLIAKEVRQLYSYDMAKQLDVDYYRVANKAEVTNNLCADINFAHQTFLRTQDLQSVREELHDRQMTYRTHKHQQKEREEQVKAELISRQPSKDELKELHRKMFIAEGQNESLAPPMTEEERKKLDAIIDEILPRIETES